MRGPPNVQLAIAFNQRHWGGSALRDPLGRTAVRVFAADSNLRQAGHEVEFADNFMAAGDRQLLRAQRSEALLGIHVEAGYFSILREGHDRLLWINTIIKP